MAESLKDALARFSIGYKSSAETITDGRVLLFWVKESGQEEIGRYDAFEAWALLRDLFPFDFPATGKLNKDGLLPCPFCGGDAQLAAHLHAEDDADPVITHHFANCPDCCATIPANTPESVAAIWNSRAA